MRPRGEQTAIAGIVQHAPHRSAEGVSIDLLFPARCRPRASQSRPAPKAARRRALLSRSVMVGMITAGVPADNPVMTEL